MTTKKVNGNQPLGWELLVGFVCYYMLTMLAVAAVCTIRVAISGPAAISFVWEAGQKPSVLEPSEVFVWIFWMVLGLLAALLAGIRVKNIRERNFEGARSLKYYALTFGMMIGVLVVLTPVLML